MPCHGVCHYLACAHASVTPCQPAHEPDVSKHVDRSRHRYGAHPELALEAPVRRRGRAALREQLERGAVQHQRASAAVRPRHLPWRGLTSTHARVVHWLPACAWHGKGAEQDLAMYWLCPWVLAAGPDQPPEFLLCSSTRPGPNAMCTVSLQPLTQLGHARGLT